MPIKCVVISFLLENCTKLIDPSWPFIVKRGQFYHKSRCFVERKALYEKTARISLVFYRILLFAIKKKTSGPPRCTTDPDFTRKKNSAR